jgi:hypothetical protein
MISNRICIPVRETQAVSTTHGKARVPVGVARKIGSCWFSPCCHDITLLRGWVAGLPLIGPKWAEHWGIRLWAEPTSLIASSSIQSILPSCFYALPVQIDTCACGRQPRSNEYPIASAAETWFARVVAQKGKVAQELPRLCDRCGI